MKKSVIAATLLSLAFALPALAAESNAPSSVPPKKPALSFEQRKAQILKRIEERSTKLQEEKTCVSAAKSDEDLKACRQKGGSFLGPSPRGRQGSPDLSGGSTSSQSQ